MMVSYLMNLEFQTVISVLLGIFIVIATMRFSICLPFYREGSESKMKRRKEWPLSTMVFWGSGGHTTEMIRLISNLSCTRYKPMYFVMSQSDTTSQNKILSSKLQSRHSAIWKSVYRSREVKQSWLSTVFTTVYSTADCFLLVLRVRPQLLICNGPGTSVPICYCAFLLRILGVYQPTIVYVESFCRVKYLSLTGRMIYPIADKFIVQWPELCTAYPRAEHLGRIC